MGRSITVMADVLIAGGGIAGSTMAILLGRTGRKVELFERARFPRDKACGEGLMPSGVGVLDRLGLRRRTGGAPFIGIRYYYGSRVAEGEFPEAERGLGQRRMVLDNAMFAEAVRTPGVAAHTGVRVERPIVSKGRVIGLMVDGEPRYAKLVVAADGVRSGIRRALGLDLIPKRRRVGIRAHFQLPEGREQPPWVEVFTFAGGELYVTPLPGRQVLLAALADMKNLVPPAKETFDRWWQAQPVLAKRLEGAQQVSPLSGVSPLSARARRGVSPGVVLLGDAAGFIDPVTGGGMAQAVMSAELLAKYIPRHFDASDEWLWQFEAARTRMLRSYRLMTSAMLWLSYHQRIAKRVLNAVRFAPGIFSRLLVVAAGRPIH